MAVLLDVAISTVTVWELSKDSVTVKTASTVPILPSTTVTSLTESDGMPSSSVIVPAPWLSVMLALTGVLRSRVKVSEPSLTKSSTIGTEIVPESEPAGMLKVPEVDV